VSPWMVEFAVINTYFTSQGGLYCGWANVIFL
jgi:hypothetical protein